MTTTELFQKHFGNVGSVDMKHPNMENFFNELNEECEKEDIGNLRYIQDCISKGKSVFLLDVNRATPVKSIKIYQDVLTVETINVRRWRNGRAMLDDFCKNMMVYPA